MLSLAKYKKPGIRFRMYQVIMELKADKAAYAKFKKLATIYKDDQAFYHLVFPNARTTCCHPKCDSVTKYKRNGDKWGYNRYCSNKCDATDPARKSQRKKTNERIWGGHPMQNPTFKRERDDRYESKHGVRNPAQNPKVQVKMAATNLKRYGAENTFASELIKERIVKTNLAKYGHENPMQSPLIRKQLEEKCLAVHGVRNFGTTKTAKLKRSKTWDARFGGNPMYDANVVAHQQSMLHSAHRINIEGVEFVCRGYEHYALKVLNNRFGIPAVNMYTIPSKQHTIWWHDGKNKKHRYYTDIRVLYKRKDISVEVKSSYTVGVKDKQIFLTVRRKALAAYRLGIDLRIWVVIPNKRRIVRISNFHELTWQKLNERFT